MLDILHKNITIYCGSCRLTVLLGCFDLSIDLVLQVPVIYFSIIIFWPQKSF